MLEMLLENPLIIIILLGIISSLYNSSKVEENNRPHSEGERPRRQQTERPQQQQPRFELPDLEKHIFGEKDAQSPPQPKTVFDKMSSEVERQQQVLQQAAEIEQLKTNKQRKEIGDMDIQSTSKQNLKKDVKQGSIDDSKKLPTTGKRLVDGIIFAEILGQPRAKKPHTSRRF